MTRYNKTHTPFAGILVGISILALALSLVLLLLAAMGPVYADGISGGGGGQCSSLYIREGCEPLVRCAVPGQTPRIVDGEDGPHIRCQQDPQ